MVNASVQDSAIFQRIDLFWRHLKAKKMHRRGFVRSGAIEILVGDRHDAIEIADLQPHLVFNPNHLSEANGALRRVRDFDHERRLPIVTVRNERVVSAELFFDSFRLKDSLNAQHLLNLVADGGGIFEVEPGVLAQRQLPVFLVCHDLGPKVRALGGVFLKAPKVITR